MKQFHQFLETFIKKQKYEFGLSHLFNCLPLPLTASHDAPKNSDETACSGLSKLMTSIIPVPRDKTQEK